jgi:hypothetical protein
MKGLKIGCFFGLSMLIMQVSFGAIFFGTALIVRDNPSTTNH